MQLYSNAPTANIYIAIRSIVKEKTIKLEEDGKTAMIVAIKGKLFGIVAMADTLAYEKYRILSS